jgi:hypothetical protein
MTGVTLEIGVFVLALLLIVLRALAVDEVRGRLRRRQTARLEATIESLPDEVKAEWADEWRAELASVIDMPLAAMMFVRGVRRSAYELVADPALVPSGAEPTARPRSVRLRERAASAWGRFSPGRASRRRRSPTSEIERVLRAGLRLVAADIDRVISIFEGITERIPTRALRSSVVALLVMGGSVSVVTALGNPAAPIVMGLIALVVALVALVIERRGQ